MQAKIGSRLLASVAPKDKPYQVHDLDMPGFILRVQPSGVMTYLCGYRLPSGRRAKVVLGRATVLSPAQAREMAKTTLADVIKGNDPSAERAPGKTLLLDRFINDRFAPWVKAHRKSGPSSLKRLEACFPDLLQKPLAEIDTWILERWRTRRLDSGVSQSCVNRDVAVLRAALSKAVEWGILPSHPLAKLKPLRIDKRGVVRFLSVDEEVRLREALIKREQLARKARTNANAWRSERGYQEMPPLNEGMYADHLLPMVLISLNTGIRRGELFHLRWENVNLSMDVLTVDGETAKSGQTRHIPLNKEARVTLLDWHQQNGSPSLGLVFPSHDGRAFDNTKSSWVKVLRDAKIESFRWHDMRHHFASQLVMNGVDLNTVRELLGHGDLKMTLRYAHLAPKVKADAVAKLDQVRLAKSAVEPVQVDQI